jgi:hypothetical protein
MKGIIPVLSVVRTLGGSMQVLDTGVTIGVPQVVTPQLSIIDSVSVLITGSLGTISQVVVILPSVIVLVSPTLFIY